MQAAVGLVVFWPLLLALEGGDGPEASEYANLKGERAALEAASRQKGCDVRFVDSEKNGGTQMAIQKVAPQTATFADRLPDGLWRVTIVAKNEGAGWSIDGERVIRIFDGRFSGPIVEGRSSVDTQISAFVGRTKVDGVIKTYMDPRMGSGLSRFSYEGDVVGTDVKLPIRVVSSIEGFGSGTVNLTRVSD